MYKVFINNTPLFVIGTSEKSDNFSAFEFRNQPSVHEMDEVLNQYWKGSLLKPFVFVAEKPDQLFDACFRQYKKIEAAGGVIVNNEQKVLFIYRNDKWDLPKGKLDKGEKKEAAALREVEEECGITGHSLREALSPTWHVYEHKGAMVLKITYWYIMDYPGNETPTPQLEEGITKIEWRAKNNVSDILENTYQSIIDCWEDAKNKI